MGLDIIPCADDKMESIVLPTTIILLLNDNPNITTIPDGALAGNGVTPTIEVLDISNTGITTISM